MLIPAEYSARLFSLQVTSSVETAQQAYDRVLAIVELNTEIDRAVPVVDLNRRFGRTFKAVGTSVTDVIEKLILAQLVYIITLKNKTWAISERILSQRIDEARAETPPTEGFDSDAVRENLVNYFIARGIKG